MFFKRKDESEKPKYKAIYKSLHSGKIRECAVAEPTYALVNFLHQEDEDVWEMYMIVSVMPLNKAEQ